MQHTSLPGANRHRSHSPSNSYPRAPSVPSDPSSGFVTVSNSWTSIGASLPLSSGPERLPLAWSGVRHGVIDDEESDKEVVVKERSSERCKQAVFITCLHLSHAMALRDVGLYGWALPHANDPNGSMMRIMNHYVQQLKRLSNPDLQCRSAPDPSKTTIRHHLERARFAAGPESYLAVLYSGHGIQESPTEAGELWCYDVSFEDAVKTGTGPSEYIPIQLFDILTWAGSSTCYVWDCQNSGRFIRAALTEAEEIDNQLRAAAASNPTVAELHPPVYAKRQIHFAACGAEQTLPRVNVFPLTVSDAGRPLQKSNAYMMALFDNLSDDLIHRLWSELQAIMLTIAWQSLDGADYQMVFGQSGDVVSTMAGGFLLSQRVMSTYRAKPESIPHIPSSTSHPLWTHWDLILDNLFEQLPLFRRFEERPGSTSWEEELKLVSFMEDQLDSILQSENTVFTPDISRGETLAPGLSRLPIICQAALTDEFRRRACIALDACLRGLDCRGLARAVQGGALDVASQLLELRDGSIAKQVISIWASLVRNDACVKSLAMEGRTAERLTSVPAVKFFLDSLEENLGKDDDTSRIVVVQTSAVLATIANFVSGRKAPRFSTRTLRIATRMIQTPDALMQQWGALLAAEVMGCIKEADQVDRKAAEIVNAQLLSMFTSSSVEIRATSIYALSRFISSEPRANLLELEPFMATIQPLANSCASEGSALVRKELVRLFHRVLNAAGKWTIFTFVIYLLELGSDSLEREKAACASFVVEAGKRFGPDHGLRIPCARLTSMLRALGQMQYDLNASIKNMLRVGLNDRLAKLKPFMTQRCYEDLTAKVVPSTPGPQEWTPELLAGIREAGNNLLDRWDTDLVAQQGIGLSNELFEKSKQSLHAYLTNQSVSSNSLPERLNGQPESTHERTWIIRHRFIEDSLVVAEQQRGLPWRWAMKEITSPEPWTMMCCHSFLNTMIACNGSPNVLFWDWSVGRKSKPIKLNIPAHTRLESICFVNELQERLCAVAEISDGNIQVLSGPVEDPSQMRPISSFHSLDILSNPLPVQDDQYLRLVSTWWRQKGRMCVGGPSRFINVWDCPAERRERTLDTESSCGLTTIVTEPVSGNIIFAGFEDGIIKLFDLRQTRRTPLLSWRSDVQKTTEPITASNGKAVLKTGVVLGESKHITSACSNGMINVYDLRNLSSPLSSLLAHPAGMASASYQSHSGLMSTISTLNPTFSSTTLASDLVSEGISASGLSDRPRANFGLFRSTRESLTSVTQEQFIFDDQVSNDDLGRTLRPYTVIHKLRPFLSVGYGRSTLLRGSGVGKGDSTDSGSYSFLRDQSQFIVRV